MKTIAHYKHGAYLGKTETWIYGQMKHLKTFEPVMYCHGIFNLDLFPLERLRNVNISDNPVPAWYERVANKFYNPFLLLGAIRRDRPDIVHAHYGPSGYDFLLFKQFCKIPLVTTFYGSDVNRLPTINPRWKVRYQKLFKEGDLFLTEGNFMKQCLVKLGCDEKKVVVQHLGVDLKKIRFEPRRLKAGEEVKILIAGSFREKKGIPYAIEAVGIFKQRQPGKKIKVTVIGDSGGHPREKMEKKRILETVKKFGLEQDVKFLGYQPHQVFIDELYKNHIFLSPSVTSSDGDTEGGAPVSIIEASASGMPILSTLHCDIPEVVIHNETGFLVKERDPDALEDKINFLVENSQLFESIALKARSHINQNYDLSKQSQKLEAIYDRLYSLA